MPLLSFQHPTQSLRGFAAWVAAITVTFAVVLGVQSWRAVRADQVSQLTTAVQIGARAVDRYLAGLDAGIRALEPQLSTEDGDPVPAGVATVRLRQFHETQPDLVAVTLLAPDGRVLASSLSVEGASAGSPVTAGPAFATAVAAIPKDRSVTVGHAVLGPVTHRWVFPVMHVIRDRQGAPSAVVVAGVPVELLQSLWRDAPLMQRAISGLLRDDGYLVSRVPLAGASSPEELFGQPRHGGLQQQLVAHGWPREGYIEGARGIDGEQAGFVFRRLENYPLTLFVALPLHEYLLAWWQRARAPTLLLLFLALAGVTAFRYALLRQAAWGAERRAAEDALQKSEADQRYVLDRMPAGVVLHDGATGAVLWCNTPASRLLGVPADEMRGRTHHDPDWHFIHEDGRHMSADDMPVGRVIGTGQPLVDAVLGVQDPSGNDIEPVWLMVHGFPDRDERGVLRRVLVSFVDISPRRRAERALAQRERTYRLLFDNSSDGVLHTRPSGRVLAANAAACSIFALSEQQLREVRPGLLADPEDPDLKRLLEVLGREGRAHATLRLRRGDGTPFEGDVSSTLYTDADGQPCCCVIVRDVTDQRRAEAALRAKALAEEANRAKSGFVARMSHELRTPLNAILGFSELMDAPGDEPLTAPQRERIGHVRRAGEHLLRLINDLLDLSRIEAGALNVQLEDVDLDEPVRDAVREMAPVATAARVELSLDRLPEGPLRIRGDPLRLRQVVLNLLSNAIKYNRAGGHVRAALSVHRGRVRLTVRDDGLGMSSEQLAHLFQPFNRLGREGSGIEGTGIGLVITRSLVDMMGGTLEAASQSDRGSEFRVEFPLRSLEADRAMDAVHPATPAAAVDGAAVLDRATEGSLRLSPAPADPIRLRPDAECHVLYIDDDDVNRELMRAFFQRRPDLVLRTAVDGEEGLRLARLLHPPLLLIDLMMPGLDGFDVLRALRSDDGLAPACCVAVSANAMPAEIDEALAEGFDAYLTKPLSSDALMRAIDRFLVAG